MPRKKVTKKATRKATKKVTKKNPKKVSTVRKTSISEPCDAPPSPFRFLFLPPELLCMIYHEIMPEDIKTSNESLPAILRSNLQITQEICGFCKIPLAVGWRDVYHEDCEIPLAVGHQDVYHEDYEIPLAVGHQDVHRSRPRGPKKPYFDQPRRLIGMVDKFGKSKGNKSLSVLVEFRHQR